MPLPHLLDEGPKGMKDWARKGQKNGIKSTNADFIPHASLYVTKLCLSSHFTLIPDVP